MRQKVMDDHDSPREHSSQREGRASLPEEVSKWAHEWRLPPSPSSEEGEERAAKCITIGKLSE